MDKMDGDEEESNEDSIEELEEDILHVHMEKAIIELP